MAARPGVRVAVANGDNAPHTKKSVRIDPVLHRRLKRVCFDRDVKVHDAVEDAVRKWLRAERAE